MNSKFTSQLDIAQSNIFTNSIIDINIPSQSQSPNKLFFVWKSSGEKSILAVQEHSDQEQKKNPNSYICSPLDYGLVITVTIKESEEGEVLEKMNYGPVKVEKKLVEEIRNYKNEYPVRVVLNKNQEKSAELKLFQKTDEARIELVIDSNPLLITFEQNHKAIPPKGLLRIYPDQPNYLGIYINHQLQSFTKFLKNFKICCHFGHYIKVGLEDRITRDILICQLMKRSGFKIEEIDKFLSQGNSSKKPKINVKLGEVASQNKKTVKETAEIQLTERVTRPEANNVAKNSKKGDKKDQLVPENIIEDIYNILYTPMSNYEHEEKMKEFKFESGKSIMDRKDRSLMLQSHCVQPHGFYESKKEVDTEENKNSQNDSQSIKTIKNEYQTEYQYITFKKKTGSMIYDEEIENKDATNALTPRQTKTKKKSIGKEENEPDVSEKLSQVMKLNEELLKQNAKLKEENLKLRFQKVKNESPQVNKMLEIKGMVQAMACRLQQLQNKNEKQFSMKTLKNPFIPNAMQASDKSKSPFKRYPVNPNLTQNYSQISLEDKSQSKKIKSPQWNGTKTEQIKKEDIMAAVEKDIKSPPNYLHYQQKSYFPQNRQSPDSYKKMMKAHTLQSPQHRQQPKTSQIKSPLHSGQGMNGKIMKPPIIYFQN